MKTTRLQKMIPTGHVMLLFWVRCEYDSPDTAGGIGRKIIPAKGCVAAARELDIYGDKSLGVRGGHGVTILWPSGRQCEIRAND